MTPSRLLPASVLACVFAVTLPVHAEPDFAALTTLAQGAISGATLTTPLSGFEVLVLQNGVPIYNQAFGSWTRGQRGNVDSATKTMTGAPLMALTEGSSGLTLDSKLSTYLPSLSTPVKSTITVRQAFTHLAGFPASGSTNALTDPNISLQTSASRIAGLGLLFTPGTRFSYGGEGMQLAGAAMEVAAGKPFADMFRDLITAPLHLNDTSFVLASATNPRVAGGLESTVNDYGRFMDVLLNGGVDRATGTRVLTSASVAEMMRNQVDASVPIRISPTRNTRYGIGIWLDQLGNFGPTVDALAVGARGWNSWIDEAQGLVFVFGTDRMALGGDLGDVLNLSSQMHAAIRSAVPEPESWALLSLGLLAVAAGAARRRAAVQTLAA